MKKQLLSVLLALIIIIGALPVDSVFAATTATFYWPGGTMTISTRCNNTASTYGTVSITLVDANTGKNVGSTKSFTVGRSGSSMDYPHSYSWSSVSSGYYKFKVIYDGSGTASGNISVTSGPTYKVASL